MTPNEIVAILAELGWSRRELARRLEAESGEAVDDSTLYRYTKPKGEKHHRAIPPGLAAYLRLTLKLKRAGLSID